MKPIENVRDEAVQAVLHAHQFHGLGPSADEAVRLAQRLAEVASEYKSAEAELEDKRRLRDAASKRFDNALRALRALHAGGFESDEWARYEKWGLIGPAAQPDVDWTQSRRIQTG